MFEVIVVGGGPAGLSGALTLGRAHRRTLVLDSGTGRNAPADAVHNFFTRDGTPPAEVRAIAREQLGVYPTVEVRDAEVARVEALPEGQGFQVELTDGTQEQAKRLLLASGLTDHLPAIDGVGQLWGRSVFHCPYCHGFESSGKPIAVIGGEPDRVRLALHLSRFSGDVVLCTNGPAEFPPPIEKALQANNISVRTAPIARLDSTGEKLEAVVFEDGESLARDAAFVKTSWTQRSPVPGQLGCTTFPDATVEINEFHQTSVPGVYAAGDMSRRATVPVPLAAVIAAAASGTVAASVLDQDLISLDFGLPNPFATQGKQP